MKLSPSLLRLAVSAAGGFILVSLGLWLPPVLRTAVTADSPASKPETAAITSGPAKDDAEPGTGPEGPVIGLSGKALAEQLRAALRLEGLDPAWADDLAADSAEHFPELLERIHAGDAGASPPPGREEKQKREQRSRRLLELLMGRWAALDPQGGLAYLKGKGDDKRSNAARRGFFHAWLRLDFNAAADKAAEFGEDFLSGVLLMQVSENPKALLEWLTLHPGINPLKLFNVVHTGDVEEPNQINGSELESLTRMDPNKMLIWSRQLPEKDLPINMIMSIAEVLAERDPDQAAAWAESLIIPYHSGAALLVASEVLGVTDPARALALLEKSLFPLSIDDKSRVIEAFDIRDPEQSRALAETLPAGALRTRLMQRTLGHLLERDPAKAFALADSPETEPGVADGTFLAPESAKTPEGARRLLEAAAQARESAFREGVVRDALLAWMQRDASSLAAYVKGQPDTPLTAWIRTGIHDGLAAQAVLTGEADPALTALMGPPPPEAMVKALQNIDPPRAAEYLATVEKPDPALASGIALRLEREAAVEMAGRLRDPDAQAAVMATLADRWMEDDSLQASEWIATLPPGRNRDSAVLEMTRSLNRTDPDLAWNWALSMTDPPLKTQALAAAAKAWSRKDAAGFTQALNAGNLTESERRAAAGGEQARGEN